MGNFDEVPVLDYETTELVPLSPFTNNKYTLIDNDDGEKIANYSWQLHTTGYARAVKGGKVIYMHRLINETPKGMFTDHINGNKLDNRKSNLRSGTQYQNQNNIHRAKGYEKVGNRYFVRIYHYNHRYDFGCYDTALLAKHIYWDIKNQLKEAVWTATLS